MSDVSYEQAAMMLQAGTQLLLTPDKHLHNYALEQGASTGTCECGAKREFSAKNLVPWNRTESFAKDIKQTYVRVRPRQYQP